MLNVDKLADRVRRYTHSQSFTDSATLSAQRGVQTQTLVDLFNDGIRALQSIIYSKAPSVFIGTGTIDLVAGQEAYDLPTDAFLNGSVIGVEYKHGSNSGDYSRIRKKSIHQRASHFTGVPTHYIHYNNKLLINPVPTSAKTAGLRVTYEIQKPTVDVRRGQISSFGGTANAPTTLVMDSSTNSLLEVALSGDVSGMYITVVDKDGVQQMKSIPVSSYDAGTDTITLGSFTAGATEAVAAGDWVVIGTNATTHPDFPDLCEAWLVQYVKAKVLDLLGDPQATIAFAELSKLQLEIELAFANMNYDIEEIAILDENRRIDYLG